MVETYNLDQIKSACRNLSFIDAIEAGFAAYSRGEVVVPHERQSLTKRIGRFQHSIKPPRF